jgi:DHA1 family inner membrane transport protein
VIAAGLGYGAPSAVGAGLAALGLGLAVVGVVQGRRSRTVARPEPVAP